MNNTTRSSTPAIFRQYYRDLHVARWAQRNLPVLQKLFLAAAIYANICALVDIYKPLIVTTNAAALLLLLCAVDALYTRHRINLVLRALSKQGVFMSAATLLIICKNEIPK